MDLLSFDLNKTKQHNYFHCRVSSSQSETYKKRPIEYSISQIFLQKEMRTDQELFHTIDQFLLGFVSTMVDNQRLNENLSSR